MLTVIFVILGENFRENHENEFSFFFVKNILKILSHCDEVFSFVLGVATSEVVTLVVILVVEAGGSWLTTLIAVGTLSFWGTAFSLANFPLGAINREKALSCCTILEYRVRKNCQVM